ncbi:MAG: hypothetical protein SGPRY_011430, partial [Prymnesium sp.]
LKSNRSRPTPTPTSTLEQKVLELLTRLPLKLARHHELVSPPIIEKLRAHTDDMVRKLTKELENGAPSQSPFAYLHEGNKDFSKPKRPREDTGKAKVRRTSPSPLLPKLMADASSSMLHAPGPFATLANVTAPPDPPRVVLDSSCQALAAEVQQKLGIQVCPIAELTKELLREQPTLLVVVSRDALEQLDNESLWLEIKRNMAATIVERFYLHRCLEVYLWTVPEAIYPWM